ncbi:hypothetical protein [Caviibacter abscessus]|uniref:hypothetical protein n=1 Tax=Caviibacter abscessus TaxID=1766719 RepID=UPI0012E359FA|nr:hypothetical protein [Caviibacter abscessus]
MEKYKRYTLRLSEEMDSKLKKLASQKYLTKNALVRIAIDEFLKINNLNEKGDE